MDTVRRQALFLFCSLVTPLLGACSGDGPQGADAGQEGPGADLAMPVAGPDLAPPTRLSPGEYVVSAVRDLVDGCKIDPVASGLIGPRFQLSYDGMNNLVLEGFGQGKVADDKGTLVLMMERSVGACSYTARRQSDITITAPNHFTAAFREDDTGRAAACTPNVGASCTSTWTMDWQKAQ